MYVELSDDEFARRFQGLPEPEPEPKWVAPKREYEGIFIGANAGVTLNSGFGNVAFGSAAGKALGSGLGVSWKAPESLSVARCGHCGTDWEYDLEDAPETCNACWRPMQV